MQKLRLRMQAECYCKEFTHFIRDRLNNRFHPDRIQLSRDNHAQSIAISNANAIIRFHCLNVEPAPMLQDYFEETDGKFENEPRLLVDFPPMVRVESHDRASTVMLEHVRKWSG